MAGVALGLGHTLPQNLLRVGPRIEATALPAPHRAVILAGMTGCKIDWGVLAAWAQAVLTALAVFMAAWLQDRAIRRREAAELRRRLDALGGLLMAARGEVERARGVLVRMSGFDFQKALAAWQGGPAAPYIPLPDLTTIRRVLQAVEEVPLHELPSWVLAEATLAILKQLGDVEPLTGIILSKAAATGQVDPNPLADQLVAANKAIEVFEDERERLLKGALR